MTSSARTMQIENLLKAMERIDLKEFKKLHKTRCKRCGEGTLHQANYPRKPRGLGLNDPAFGRKFKRLSLCCSKCRRRTQPVSILFPFSTVYCVLILLFVVFFGRKSGRFKQIKPATKRRWLLWWGSHEEAKLLSWLLIERFFSSNQTTSKPSLMIGIRVFCSGVFTLFCSTEV